mgnify:FL=1
MGARETAFGTLAACRRQGGWSNAVLKESIRKDKLDGREAALATRLVYGVVQNRGRLDFYLKQLLKGKLRDLHPATRDILHLGLYQIYDLDRIPDSAAVNEAVALAKKYVPQSQVGLVNGVLRSAVRTKGSLREPTSFEDKYSHPEALVSLLKANVPKGMLESILQADNAAPDTVIQVNTTKTDAESLIKLLKDQNVEATPHSWMADCLVLSGTGNLENLPAFREGLFYVQDPASRLSVRCAELPKAGGIRLLDCCAAPGGKSFAAAMDMGGRGTVLSRDVHPHKIALIENGAKRLGLTNIQAGVQDAAQFVPEWQEAMDVVLVDAPCSGLGIIRKKPDIRCRDLESTKELPELQKAILWNQARYVKKGGVLMYSTCTVLKRENEEVVAAFLEAHPDFFLEKLNLPEIFPENDTGMLTLYPGQWDTDGFFIARLRRKL